MAEIASLVVEVDSSGVKKADKDLDKFSKTSNKTEKSTGSLADSFGDVSKAAGALGVALSAVQLAAIAKDSALAAARFETLGVVMNNVGKNFGYTSAQMATFAGNLEKTGISMVEARQSITRMTQAQLDLTKSSELARVAQDAAVIGNINSSEAFERMVVGIQSAQVEILRNIGINVSFENSYKKVAAATGRTVAELGEAEKTQIRMNAAIEAGRGIAGTYSAAMETTGKKLSSITRLHQNLQVEIGKTFQPAVNSAVDAYKTSLEGVLGVMQDLNKPENALVTKQAMIQRAMESTKQQLKFAKDPATIEYLKESISLQEKRLKIIQNALEAEKITDTFVTKAAERRAAEVRGIALLEEKQRADKKAAEEEEKQRERDLANREQEQKRRIEERLRLEKDISNEVVRLTESEFDYRRHMLDEEVKELEAAGVDEIKIAEYVAAQKRKINQEELDDATEKEEKRRKEIEGQTKKTATAYEKAWERSIERLDDSFVGMWENIFKNGELELDSFKNVFEQTLAELAHAAITRPIVVQLATSMMGGTVTPQQQAAALAQQQISGGMGFPSGFGGLMPSGSGDIFGLSGITSGINQWGAGQFPSMFGMNSWAGQAAYESAVADSLASGASIDTAVKAGIDASKASGTTFIQGLGGVAGIGLGALQLAEGNEIGGLSSIAAGAMMFTPAAPFAPLVALGGSLLGGLFGGGKKKPPPKTVQTNIQALWGADWGEAAEQGAWSMYGGDPSAFGDFYDYVGDVTDKQRAAVTALLAGAGKHQEQVFAALEHQYLRLGQGFDGITWELNNRTDWDALSESVQEQVEKALWQGVSNASVGLDWSSFLVDVDFSTAETTKKSYEMLNAYEQIDTAIEKMLNPADTLSAAIAKVSAQFEGYKRTLESIGAKSEALTELERQRAEALKMTEIAIARTFDQDITLRAAQLDSPSGVGKMRLQYQQAAELEKAIATFGEGSARVAELSIIQAKEMQNLERQELESARAKSLQELESAQSAYKQELESSIDALDDFADTLRDTRRELLLSGDTSTLSVSARYGLASSQFRALSERAMAGDQTAIENLAEISSQYLDVSREYNADFASYQRDFDRVQQVLKSVEDSAGDQADAMRLEAERTQNIVDSITGQTSVLSNSLSALGARFDAALAGYKQAAQPTPGASSGGGLSASSQIINQIYRDVLGREADPGGAAFYQGKLAAGKTPAQIREEIRYERDVHGARATGGAVSAGMTYLVGEQGPELFTPTGGGYVHNNTNTQNMLDNSAVVAAINRLIAHVDSGNLVIARNTRKTALIQQKWDDDGLPQESV